MTKKDFELIASILRNLGEFEGVIGSGLHFDSSVDRVAIAEWFANELAHTNPLFDREKFIKACLPQDGDV